MDKRCLHELALALHGVYLRQRLMTFVPLKQSIQAWPRGTARREGEWIVFSCLDVSSADAVDPSTVGLDLSRVRTPDEAVAFVARYGPLENIPDSIRFAQRMLKHSDGRRVAPHEPIEIRQSVTNLLEEAGRLGLILRMAIAAQKSAAGDVEKRVQLSRYADTVGISWMMEGAPIETCVTWELSKLLTGALADARPEVNVLAPGRFEVSLVPTTLLGYCYLNVAKALSERGRLGICAECARVFEVEDGRQKFCEQKCATRARFQRFKQKQAAAPRSSTSKAAAKRKVKR